MATTKSKAKGAGPRVETRGRKKGHAPSNITGKGLPTVDLTPDTDEKRQLVSRLVTETLRTYGLPKVESDEELEQRFADYFQHCALTGEKPTVEQLAQCTGYTMSTLWDWENGRNKGFSTHTSRLVKKAKEFLRVFDAKLILEGAVNPVAYIFRAKNYYGMKDQQDVVVAPQQPLGPDPDEAQLAANYLKALPDADYPTMEEVKKD